MTLRNLRPKAVIFDLWKTLVPLSDASKEAAFLASAKALGEQPEFLRSEWGRTRVVRESVALSAYLYWLRGELGRTWTYSQIDGAIEARKRIHSQEFEYPLDDALEALKLLRKEGIFVGVISNGTSDVADMVRSSALASLVDTLVVSADVGVRKPAASIYEIALDGSGAAPAEAVYVGDGMDRELEGARCAGFRPILVDRGTPNDWEGESVADLTELLMTILPN